jgi:hypothetical protein
MDARTKLVLCTALKLLVETLKRKHPSENTVCNEETK